MHTVPRLFACLVVLVVVSLANAGGQQPAGTSLAITSVTIIDVSAATEEAAIQTDRTVIIRAGRISDGGNSSTTAVPADAQRIDGRGKYLIPGLWDMHVHVLSPRKEAFLPLLIANGVTGVRDMATAFGPDEIARVRQRIADGSLVGPRMFVAGPLLSGGSGGRSAPGRIAQVWTVTTSDEARGAVATLIGERVDFLKVYSYLKRDVFEAIAEQDRYCRTCADSGSDRRRGSSRPAQHRTRDRADARMFVEGIGVAQRSGERHGDRRRAARAPTGG